MGRDCEAKEPDAAYGIDHVCGLRWLHRGEHKCWCGYRWSGERLEFGVPEGTLPDDWRVLWCPTCGYSVTWTWLDPVGYFDWAEWQAFMQEAAVHDGHSDVRVAEQDVVEQAADQPEDKDQQR